MLLDMHNSQKYVHTDVLKFKTLPKVGYIAYIGKTPVAAGFLRRLEPCFAQLDTLVSNAYCGALLRNDGINKVVDALIEEGKKLKLKGIIAHTQDKSTIVRAQSIGFHIVPETIIALSLQEKPA